MKHLNTSKTALSLCLWAALAMAPGLSSAQSTGSGFIENLPADMKPDAAGPGSMRWQSPTASLASDDKILLQPLTIYVAPVGKGADAPGMPE